MIARFLTSSYGWILVLVLLANFCQNLTYSKDSSCAGVTHQNTQIGTKSGSGCFHTPRFPSPNLESRVKLWKLGKPWWRGLKRSQHILWRRLGRHGNMWWASQFRGALWVWNREGGHDRRIGPSAIELDLGVPTA
jgi:hypothetical protein